MTWFFRSLAILALLLASPVPAQIVNPGSGGGGTGTVGTPDIVGFSVGGTGTVISSSNPLPVAGTFSATLSGFTPTPSYATLSVSSGASSRVAIPTGTVDVIYNTGSYPASILFGNSSVTATASDDQVPAGGWLAITVPSGATDLAGWGVGGATSLVISGGAGLPTGSGGGGVGAIPTGTAGSPNAAVLSIQGISSGTAIPIAGYSGTAVDSAAGTPNSQALTIQGNASGVAVPVSGTVTSTLGTVGTPDITGYSVSGTATTDTGDSYGRYMEIKAGSYAAGLLAGNAHIVGVTGATLDSAAGTPNSQALTIQGNSSGVAIPAILAAGSNTVGSVDVLGHAGATLDSAAGTGLSQALAIQGVSGGVAVPVTGTLSASIGAFQPTPAYAALTVGATSARVALPTGTDVIVYNTGANPAYLLLGNSSVTATASDDVLLPNSWIELAVGSAVDLAAIETAGATTLTISGGAGIAAGSVGVPSTQAVSLASLPSLVAGSATIGKVDILGNGGASMDTTPGGSAATNAMQIQGVASMTPVQVSQATASSLNATVIGTGTFVTQSAITAASGSINSGAIASGAVASGAFASGALSAGSIASGAAVSGAFATGAIADLALAQGSTTSGQKANLILGAATTSAPSDTTGDSWPLSLTTAGGLRTDMSTIAGTTTLTGTGAVAAGAQRIAVGTDTATIAGSAPGTAGTASANVLTVQGIASMTPLLENPGTIATWGLMSGTTPGTAPTNTLVVGGMYNSAAPSPTTGQTLPLQLDASGYAEVDIKAGAGGGTASVDKSTWTVSTTSQTIGGCEYTSGGATALSTGQMGAFGCTSARALFTDKSSVGGTALSSPTEAYGTAFASQTATVERVDAFVTNTNANGPTISANASPVVIASDQVAVAIKGTADNSAFTANTTPALAISGVYQTTATSNPLSAGDYGMAQLTHYRALQTDWYNSSGTEMGTSGSPVQVSLANTASNATAVLVTGSGGNFPVALNGTPTLANGNGVVPTQGGSVLSATNGAYADILTAQAAVTAANPLYAGIVGHANGVLDFAGQNAAQPASSFLIGGEFNTTPTTITNGNASPLQLDNAGNLLVNVKAGSLTNISGTISLPTGAATSANQPTNSAIGATTSGQTGTVVMGAASTALPTATTADSWPLSIVPASGGVRTDLASVAGTATLTGAGAVGAGAQRMAVGQDSTTIAGATPGRTYNTIAASQTAQALTGGSGGATGDYLSHCVVFPTTTSPGVVTILDNATTIDAFPGGASSLSNLVPFAIPVGAVSTSGAWKVTTGAGLSVTCSGKFT